ncbi:hypothetical protein D3C84_892370 [compost metagenome]
MVEPRHFGFVLRGPDRMSGAVGQQFGSGRSAKLIMDDRHFTALLAKTQHGLGKVGATGGVDPTGAEDQVTSAESCPLFPC